MSFKDYFTAENKAMDNPAELGRASRGFLLQLRHKFQGAGKNSPGHLAPVSQESAAPSFLA